MERKAQGNTLYAQGKVAEAIKSYGKGIDALEGERGKNKNATTTLALLYCNRSKAHLALCLVDEAVQDAECAIDTDPENGKAYMARAEVLLHLFQFRAAIEDLDKAEELEPGLAPHSSQERRRANGEWFQNCYLQKHLQLRKTLKCGYVLFTEYEGEEILEPMGSIEAVDPLVAVLFPREKIFDALCNVGACDGSIERLSCFLSSVCSVATKTRERIYKDKSLDFPPFTYETIVHSQMKREFGPNAVLFKPVGCQTSKIDVSEETLFRFVGHPWADLSRSGLVNCYCGEPDCKMVKDFKSRPDRLGPILFPGAPRWIDDKAIQDRFLPGFMRTAGIGKKKRGKVLAQAREFRQKPQEDGRFTCHGCGKVIGISDPQECVCGMKFCTYECHTASWHGNLRHGQEPHKLECRERLLSMPQDYVTLDVTSYYWGAVSRGELPCKDEPDCVALWEKNRVPQQQEEDEQGGEKNEAIGPLVRSDVLKSDPEFQFRKSDPEFQFYLAEECKQLDWEHEQLVRSNLFSKKYSIWTIFVHDLMKKWNEKMASPAESDSPARILAKWELCFHLLNFGRHLQKTLTCSCKDCVELPDIVEAWGRLMGHANRSFAPDVAKMVEKVMQNRSVLVDKKNGTIVSAIGN